MTDETAKNGPDAAADAQIEPQVQEETNSTGEDAGQDNDPTAALQAENAELRDRFLRLAAEMDNLRRRTERDVKDAKSYAVTAFARDMLAVSDNLRRAIDAVPDEARRRKPA